MVYLKTNKQINMEIYLNLKKKNYLKGGKNARTQEETTARRSQPDSHATLIVFYPSIMKHNKIIYLPALEISTTVATVN